jgi:predicted nucleotidyltransferase
MQFQRPLTVITPTLDGDVLSALARADREFSGRELARHVAYGSTEGIRRAADRLVAEGVVSRRAAGAAHMYRLNREHVAAPWIEGLASLREQVLTRLRDHVREWQLPPRVALLFGSVARGDAGLGSDLDILVLRRRGCDAGDNTWRDQLLDLQQSASTWTGNDTRVLEYGEDELSGELEDPVLWDALQDGIELYGSRRTMRRLLGSVAA